MEQLQAAGDELRGDLAKEIEGMKVVADVIESRMKETEEMKSIGEETERLKAVAERFEQALR